MKPFTFRLETVLTVRERDEERAREIYSASLRARAETAAQLQSVRDEIAAYHQALTAMRAGSSHGSDQLVFLRAIQAQQARQAALAAELAKREREVTARREEFLAARRKREALTRLKDHQRAAHASAAQRAAEESISELITARHGRPGFLDAAAAGTAAGGDSPS